MQRSISELDRRRFLRGSGIALSLPVLTSAVEKAGDSSAAGTGVKRLACFYQPDGVPMPLAEDPAYQDWAWFPHGNGREFQLTKCLQPLESLRSRSRCYPVFRTRRLAAFMDIRMRISF
ncbi:MAG UNVERIFIED_CONTAM: DUF1552 domain-containing protein [Planctomycetaceae bacterium]|jgi:hypothetical protein